MTDVVYTPSRLHWPSAMKRLLKAGGNSSSSSTSRSRSTSTSTSASIITTSSEEKSSRGGSSDPKLNLSFKKSKRKEAVKQLIRAFDIPPPSEIDNQPPTPTLSVWMEQARWETSIQAVFPVFEHDELPP